ncbi:MAG: SpoIVB peptidase [Clostridia bacterium]|nr:SpoIVB peptidase [Clostridia bacterium]
MNPRVRRWVGLVLAIAVLVVGFTPPYQTLERLPDQLQLTKGSQTALDLAWQRGWLAIRGDRPSGLEVDGAPLGTEWRALRHDVLRLNARAVGVTRVQLALLGWLPLRTVTVDVRPTVTVVPGGQAIGIVLHSDGVVVVDEAGLRDRDGRVRHPAQEAGIRVGDVIVSVGGQAVTDKEDAARKIDAAARTGRAIAITVRRDGQLRTYAVQPVWDVRAGRYLVGVWIRDGASGVGTMTFYDPQSRRFAALGHVISDTRTGDAYAIHDGQIVEAIVSDIDRGAVGAPGEKLAVFVGRRRPLGILEKNTEVGVFGRLSRVPDGGGAAVPVALPQEVHPGAAVIRTVLHGQKVDTFDVEIERVITQDRPASKGLILHVTDPRLLREAGGIVQGMSGSPILQDGKLVGAVTHVFVNDPTRGYGVLALWMAEKAGLMSTPSAAAPGS